MCTNPTALYTPKKSSHNQMKMTFQKIGRLIASRPYTSITRDIHKKAYALYILSSIFISRATTTSAQNVSLLQ